MKYKVAIAENKVANTKYEVGLCDIKCQLQQQLKEGIGIVWVTTMENIVTTMKNKDVNARLK